MNDAMTLEQIKACQNYLDIIDVIKAVVEDGDEFLGTPYAFELRRQEAHDELVRVYGFNSFAETCDVTGNIPKGMLPRELHNKLIALKQKT